MKELIEKTKDNTEPYFSSALKGVWQHHGKI